jgi:gliding motility-associated-like protein
MSPSLNMSYSINPNTTALCGLAPIAGNVISNLSSGTYTVTGTDTLTGCSGTLSVTIGITLNEPVVQISAIVLPGCGQSNGMATVTGIGGTPSSIAPNYSYSLSGASTGIIGISTGLLTGIQAGNAQTIYVTDSVGCAGDTTITMVNPNGPIITATPTNSSCTTSCDGKVTMSPSLSMSYSISPNPTSLCGLAVPIGNVIPNLPAGTYVVTGTDVNGCVGSTSVTINANPNVVISATTTPTGCNVSNCIGTATMIPANFTYTILPSLPLGATITGNVISGLCSGTYSIKGTNAVGCSDTLSVIIGTSPSPSITLVTASSVLIVPNTTSTIGLINTSVIPSSPNYTYTTTTTSLVTPSPITTPTSNTSATTPVLAKGAYTIIVTNSITGCKDTLVQSIDTSSISCTLALTNPVLCHNDTNAIITATVAGGIQPIDYYLNNVLNTPSPTSNVFDSLSAGIYTVKVVDASGASASSVITIANPGDIVFNAPTIVIPGCNPDCNGSISISASTIPATIIVSYSIQSPVVSTCAPLQSSLGVFTNIGSGTYTVTATNANGCSKTTTVLVGTPTPPSITATTITNVTCNGLSNGKVVVNATAGSNPLSLYGTTPTPTNSSNTINGLAANAYTIYVVDTKGCFDTTHITITEPLPMVIDSAFATNILCNGQSNGKVTFLVSGGTPFVIPANAYNYTPVAGQSSLGHWTGLAANTYIMNATDSKGCSISDTFIITMPTLVTWVSKSDTDLTCFGANDGKIIVSATGGTGTISYSINTIPVQTNTNGNFLNLAVGTYTVTAKDNNGCLIASTFIITQPPAINLTAPVLSPVLCYGASTGGISTTASGGTPFSGIFPYRYILSIGGVTIDTNKTGSFTSIPAGTYIITAFDSIGCSKAISGTITQPPAYTVTATATFIECFGQPTGTITTIASGGTPSPAPNPYAYTLNPSTFPITQTGLGFFENVSAGVYVITAKDAKNCTIQTTVIVNQNAQLQFPIIELFEPICKGESNGKIYVQGSGGVAPYQYSINGGLFQTDTFKNLPAGTYTIRIQDSKGCTNDKTITLTEPNVVGASFTTFETLCIGSDDGRLVVQGIGGRGGYKYYVKPGLYFNKSGIFNGLSAGTYTIKVVDTSRCEFSTTFVITDPSNGMKTSISGIDLGCTGRGNEGSAIVNINGGSPPFTYLWNTDPVQITQTAVDLYFGNYQVEVIDANGCVAHDSIRIKEGNCCDIAFIPSAFSPNGDTKNDEFRILSTAGILLEQLEIRDRWGKRVWSSTSTRLAWDGTIDGQPAVMATYYYVLRYKCTTDNKTYLKKGDVTLVR